MELKDIEKLYLERQSCRKYDVNKKVDSQTLKRVVEASLLAPSACNSQPWKIIATNKSDVVSLLAKQTHTLGRNKFTDECTAFAVITETPANLTERAGVMLTGREFVSNDLGILTAHLVLAAKAAGIESCILGLFDEKEVKKILSIPENHRVRLLVSMGYSAEDDVLRKKSRKDKSQTCQFIFE